MFAALGAPGTQLSRALEVVLRKRPCRVVIDPDRAQSFEAAGAPAATGKAGEPVGVAAG